ncbi:MAG: pyridoxal-phosphate dependent enzyme [Acholeplasmataceae bacterium]
MLKSGKTPLLRARKLEEVLGIKRIFLKLEGSNPSGHKHDRIAEVLIKDLLAQGYDTLLAHGSFRYLTSLIHFAQQEDVRVLIPIFKYERWKSRYFSADMLLDFRKSRHESASETITEYARKNNCYLAYEGYTNTHISQMVLEELTEEIIYGSVEPIDDFYIQFGYGYTLTSMYNAVLKSWLNGRIRSFPNIMCGTFLNEDYLIANGDHEDWLTTTEKRSLFDQRLIDESRAALRETHGDVIRVSDELLRESVTLLKRYERVIVTRQEAYAFAAFLKQQREKPETNKNHVIVLNDGVSSIRIERIHDFERYSKETILDYTRTWLAQYSDPTIEMVEAIEQAMEKGYVLIASTKENVEGICIVVHTGFADFLPTYHLGYIGITKQTKGRGVGTELIKRAIDLTGEKLSLHVDPANQKAKKLYEKMGFRHVYDRMIYQGK